MSHRVQTETPVNRITDYKLNQKPFIMFFQTETCGVCHALQPRLKEILENFEVKFVTIDAQRYPSIAGQHQVFTVPTIIIWAENREILRESRYVNFSKIERALEFMQIYETKNEVLSYRNN